MNLKAHISLLIFFGGVLPSSSDMGTIPKTSRHLAAHPTGRVWALALPGLYQESESSHN